MNSDRLQYLFDAFRKSSCTKEELAELNEWYDNLHTGEKIEDVIAEAGSEKQLADQLYQNFFEKASKHQQHKSTVRWWSVAAAAIILITTGLLLYNTIKDDLPKNEIAAMTPILPGGNKAILTLADGTRINLSNSPLGKIYNKNGLLIIKPDSGSLTYSANASLKTVAGNQMQFNSIYVPKGGQYKVTLADGTKVWINSASTFKFPVTSNGKDRSVSLTGEGYFEVAHNKHQPFKVSTADQLVRVLGTHFNIKGYHEDGGISTTLLEGSVQVSSSFSHESKRLMPGQQANISGGSPGISVKKVNVDQATAWKNGYFIFDNQDIRSIMNSISRWYNVDVTFQNGVSQDRFGGTFSRHSNLSEILDNLQELGDVEFQISQQKVVVLKVTK